MNIIVVITLMHITLRIVSIITIAIVVITMITLLYSNSVTFTA